MMSSTIPSAKYSCSGSPLMLVNGNTAMEGLSDAASGRCDGYPRRASDAIDAHRLGNVLQGLRAQVIEAGINLVPDVVKGCAGNQHATRFCDAFKTGRDVDAVTIEIAALDHDVTQVDADAQHDTSRASGRSPFAAAMPRCRSTAHCTALTALPNSTSTPSPVTLKMRPWCRATSGSSTSFRRAFSVASVPDSSCSMRRL